MLCVGCRVIKDFDLLKKQLAELATVLNTFKSEQVQLRIVELVFGIEELNVEADHDSQHQTVRKKRRKKGLTIGTKGVSGVQTTTSAIKKSPKPRTSGGATDTLKQLVKDGYFKSPKLIGEIAEYCKTKLAKTYKSNELSPGLGRLVRDKVLDRDKDAKNNQFSYKNS